MIRNAPADVERKLGAGQRAVCLQMLLSDHIRSAASIGIVLDQLDDTALRQLLKPADFYTGVEMTPQNGAQQNLGKRQEAVAFVVDIQRAGSICIYVIIPVVVGLCFFEIRRGCEPQDIDGRIIVVQDAQPAGPVHRPVKVQGGLNLPATERKNAAISQFEVDAWPARHVPVKSEPKVEA